MKIKFYSDAGHGWFAVKRKFVEDAGFLNEISPYSYQRGGMLYLEEDCDADLLMLYLTCNNIPHEVVEGKFVERSPIRSYDRFAA